MFFEAAHCYNRFKANTVRINAQKKRRLETGENPSFHAVDTVFYILFCFLIIIININRREFALFNQNEFKCFYYYYAAR